MFFIWSDKTKDKVLVRRNKYSIRLRLSTEKVWDLAASLKTPAIKAPAPEPQTEQITGLRLSESRAERATCACAAQPGAWTGTVRSSEKIQNMSGRDFGMSHSGLSS